MNNKAQLYLFFLGMVTGKEDSMPFHGFSHYSSLITGFKLTWGGFSVGERDSAPSWYASLFILFLLPP